MVEIKSKLDSLEEHVVEHMKEEELELKHIEEYNTETRRLVVENSQKIDEMAKDISGLVNAWNTAGSVAKFIRWCAGIGTALYFFLDIIKGRT